VDPAPPRAPWSLRVWGWVILAFSILSLISFTLGLLSSFGSSPAPPAAAGAVIYLVTIATGIGFVAGWRVTWFSGLMLAVAGIAYGGWVVLQLSTTLQTRAAFAVLWVGPPLLLLTCLLLPASVRWAIGAPPPWAAASSIHPPTTSTTPPRRSLLLPIVTIVVAAIVVAAWLFLGRGPGSFPERAAGFRLIFSRTVDAGLGFGPPVGSSGDLRVVRQRIAVYTFRGKTFEVRVIEDARTSAFPHRVILLSAGMGITTSPAFPEGRLGTVTTETIHGVRYTCVHTRVAAGCIWTEGALTGWASGDGPRDVERLRQLARAVHDAMT